MKKILILATAGAGGDLHPLLAVAFGLRQRGHHLVIFGDTTVAAAVRGMGLEMIEAAPEHDLGPRLVALNKERQGLEVAAQAELARQRLSLWSQELVPAVESLLHEQRAELLLTSLFGVGVAQLVSAQSGISWCVINSTFYVGPHPPRPLEHDFHARTLLLFRSYFIPLLAQAPLVLHATDPVFDYNHTALPATHHYVGPLLWEALAPIPTYLTEPGAPWVLVTLSSLVQDDLPLAQAALAALAPHPVRVVLTLGGGHQPAALHPVPPNARVEPYVPHSAVLERSRLLLSHAGHGSVMKALWYGVPLVLVPWNRDQPGVAARAEHLGVARVVAREQLTDVLLSEAITGVLEDPHYQQRAQVVSRRLQADAPVATACELIEQM
jgi:UDP:flavonoid glycosyltransferase YjiC (YdhE family)